MPEGGGAPRYYDTTGSVTNGTQGAVWMGGAAPEVDAAGNIWAATGNGSSSTPYDGSDSVFELSPGPELGAALRPERLVLRQRERPRPRVDRARRCSRTGPPAGRQVADGLPVEPGAPRRHRWPARRVAGLCGAPTPTAATRWWAPSSTSPCDSGIEAIQTQAPPRSSVQWTAASGVARPADRRRRPRLVDRREHALRDQPGERRHVQQLARRRPGQPLPHAVGG